LNLQATLEKIVDAEQRRQNSREVLLGVLADGQLVHASAGHWQGKPIGPNTPFLIASVSKLFITAIIFQLVAECKLRLDDPMADFFDGEIDRLLIWRGRDLSRTVTVRHLLSHNSGLPDYFEGQRQSGASLADELVSGFDRSFELSDVVDWVRDDLRPAFAPGARKKAVYSDTNFYLLTKIAARVAGCDIDHALENRISRPLGLTQTRFLKPGMAALPLRFGGNILDAPLALASMPGDGGAISSLADLACFTHAFFAGDLFPKTMLNDLAPWRRIFSPLTAGMGVLRFALPRWLPPFRTDLEFIGHSGISGAIAFRHTASGRIIVGTVNQMHDRSRPYRMMIKAALA
jgi:D-alanyl-D-alanine carboxypeptidase